MWRSKEVKAESDLTVICIYFGFRTTDIATITKCEECCKNNVRNCTKENLFFGRSFTLVGLSAKERKCPHPQEEKYNNILLIQRIRCWVTKLSQEHKANPKFRKSRNNE